MIIDITRLLDRRMQGRLPTGVDRVSLEYIRYFGARATALVRFSGQWIELSSPHSKQLFEVLLSPTGNFNSKIRGIIAQSFPFSMAKRFSSRQYLFNTGHSGLEKSEYLTRLKRSGLKPIFFVHDLIPLSYPEYCRPGEAEKHRHRINMMLSMGYGLIANSQETLTAVSEYAQANGFSMPPAVVALLAPPKFPYAMPNATLNQPYFVMLGTIEPRKNHWLILHIWRQLIQLMGDRTPRLVIVGQRGWECENVVDLLERCESLKGFVFEYTHCKDTELAAWLLGAQALLFPSFIEGYGMPLIEALSMKVPVIASDLNVFREIAGDIPEYIDPLDGLKWKELILEYAQINSLKRWAQIQRMAGFLAPTWQGHFERVESFIETLELAKC